MMSPDMFHPDCPECGVDGGLYVTRHGKKTFKCEACGHNWDPSVGSLYYKFSEMSDLEQYVLLMRVIGGYDIEDVRSGMSVTRQAVIDARKRLRKRQAP